ncbi:hypothetical protein [Planctomyces sp. SH-PL14]|uniref:hypothetical protein n=1 Tax=Planctomyces sp. SH-PL14 TaxID=1632864 RepID=UPI00078D9382|nr:hypothetical protein [Planctomyces sp. SH-PL14]AMV17056.1 hypothetical protein VT03_04140 [Planctomyces sp. SH-PL14]
METNWLPRVIRLKFVGSAWAAASRLAAVVAVSFLIVLLPHRAIGGDDVEKWIDQLVARESTIAPTGLFNFLAWGVEPATDFLPLREDHEPPSGGAENEGDPALKLIKLGPAAIPLLLAHLDDDRPTGVGPFGRVYLSDYVDMNSRSGIDRPLREGKRLSSVPDSNEPLNGLNLTVGDLCFEVLGQIVNREYGCVFQACMHCSVVSPGRSAVIRAHLKKSWGGISSEGHRESLLRDLRAPDSAERQRGAYYRLAYYHPEAVEPAVLDELRRPYYSRADIRDFCQDSLFTEGDRETRRKRVTDYLLSRNETYSRGLQRELWHEALERRISAGAEDAQAAEVAREVLVDVFGEVIGRDSYDRSLESDTTSESRSEFIASLTHDRSRAIGNMVAGLLESEPENNTIAAACLRCLANRGYPDLLTRAIDRLKPDVFDDLPSDLSILVACATSRDEGVRKRLEELALTTNQGAYLVAAMGAVAKENDGRLLERAVAWLDDFPPDKAEELGVLRAVSARFPDQSLAITEQYLKTRSPARVAAVCEDIDDESDSRILLLKPFLDDRRPAVYLSDDLELRDVVARTMSSFVDDVVYSSQDSEEERALTIQKLWAHYEGLAAQHENEPAEVPAAATK